MAESIMFDSIETILHPVSLHERLKNRGKIPIEDIDMDLVSSDDRFIKTYDEKGEIAKFEYSYPWPHDHTQTVRCVFTRV